MESFSFQNRRRWAMVIVSSLVVCASAKGAETPFHSSSASFHAGETFAIPLKTAPLKDNSVGYSLKIADPGVAELIRTPDLPEGDYHTTFARIRALSAGSTILSYGPHQLKLQVSAEQEGPFDQLRTPRIYSPVQHSVAWGAFSVGVEILADDLSEEQLQAGLALRLPDRTDLSPAGSSSPGTGPLRLFRFDVDAATLPPGETRLVPRLARDGTAARTGDPLVITIAHPAQEDLVAGECESILKVERNLRFRSTNRTPRVVSDLHASEGQHVANGSSRPAWVLPFQAPREGSYQMMLRTRGDPGANSYPTIGIYLENEGQSATTCRLVDHNWHRLPVGVPFHLTNGLTHLTVYFENDFYVRGRSDRNLFLDRFELLRIPDSDERAADKGMDSMMAMSAMASSGAGSDAPRVLFDQTPPGRLIAGQAVLRASVVWDALAQPVAPETSLVIDGRSVGSQFSSQPFFILPRALFARGEHQVQVTAWGSDGAQATSEPITLVAGEAFDHVENPPMMLRFSVYDPRWDDAFPSLITRENRKARKEVATLFSNGSVTLALPESLEGPYHLNLRAMGTAFEGPPEVVATLVTEAGREELKRLELKSWMHPHPLRDVKFEPGPKSIELAFINDHYKEKVGDRNVHIEALLLHPKAIQKDTVAPRVRIPYPQPGHEVYRADAVVIEADDDRVVKWAELHLDGNSTGIRLSPFEGLGRIVLPLSVRELTPGAHTLQVKVADGAGNTTLTEPRSFQVLEAPPPTPGPYRKAVFALNRLALGPEPEELATVLIQGVEAWLQERLSDDAHARFMNTTSAVTRYPNLANQNEAYIRSMFHLLRSDNPVLTRYQLWVENHFTTWLRKTGGAPKWEEHVRLTRYSAGNFRDLLFASATSPAMLIYLDQQRSFGGSLNENYAREIMELHSLGVDQGYRQQDVTELARLLTGWMVVEESGVEGQDRRYHRTFKYDPALNDRQWKQFLGLPFPTVPDGQRFDEVKRALEMLAAHPATARYITGKLAAHYLSQPGSRKLVGRLTARFHENGGDLRALLLTLSEHPEFWAGMGHPRLSTPMDYGFHLERLTGKPEPYGLGKYLGAAGMLLYDRETPDGYPDEGEAYADTNVFLQRMRFAQARSWRLKNMMPYPASGRPKDNPSAWDQHLVDALALRLTGTLLDTASNQAALQVLADGSGKKSDPVKETLTLICQLPEAQFR